MSIAKTISRMFGREPANPFLARLYTHVIGRPLLVHPALGENLIRGLLRGGFLAQSGDENAPPQEPVAAQAGTVAVLNIQGPMTSRPEPGFCGPGPLSYEEIRSAFDAAMADDNVSAIVFRLDSIGGMVSGCFDLTDHIFASRGTKPIVCQVDDIAYSGGYAIGAACDRIQVTRTSGIGSVGVYTGHLDESEADKKAGLKFTYIFAGKHKVDGNSHEPLAEDVQEALQKEIDELRGLFVESVAKYRGMTVEAVAATEADTYGGAAGVAIGLADSVGTLRDLLAELANPAPAPPLQPTEDEGMDPNAKTETPEAKAAREASEASAAAATAATTAAAKAASDAATIAAETATTATNTAKLELLDAVNASKTLPPTVAAALLAAGPKEGVSATARVAYGQSIADACAAAKLPDTAATYVKDGATIEHVRTELAKASATSQGITSGAHNPQSAGNIFAAEQKRLTEQFNRRTGNAAKR